MTFKKAIEQMKELAQGSYFNMIYEYSAHQSTGHIQIECKAYLPNHSFAVGKTWEEAILIMRNKVNAPTKQSLEGMPEC